MVMFSGTGPGARTNDGCSVDLYRRIPYHGELDVPASHLVSGSRVLELGCGPGHGTRALLERGFAVTAVDNSKDMLESAPHGATVVCSDIETLELDERFDAVILPTGLINHCLPEVRQGFVDAGWRHLCAGGWFYIECQDPAWLDSAQPGRVGRRNGVDLEVEALSREQDIVSMTIRYSVGADTWTHSFEIVALSSDDVSALLAPFSLGPVEWLNDKKTWLRAQRPRDQVR